jgi:hypothetical protein
VGIALLFQHRARQILRLEPPAALQACLVRAQMTSKTDPTSHLNQTHADQISNYLKFFRQKREQQAKEIESAFNDTKDMRYADAVAWGNCAVF